MHHGVRAGFQEDHHLGGVIGLDELHAGAEPVDDLVDDIDIHQHFNTFGLVGVHVRHGRREVLVVNAVFVTRKAAQRYGGLVGDGHVRDAVQPVEDHVPPVFAIGHQVVALVVEDHQIRTDVLLRRLVEFLVESVLVVVVVELAAFLDGRIDQLDVVEQRLVVGRQ